MKKNLDITDRRREAVESALSSLKMEGFVFTKEELEDFDGIVYGKMTFEEHRNKYIELGQALGDKRGHA